VAQYDKISVSDWNTLRNKTGRVLDSGQTYIASGDTQYSARYQYGYGVALDASNVAVNTDTKVRESQWDAMRLDILKARTHQAGSGTLTNVALYSTIQWSTYDAYNTLADTINSSRFSVAVGEYEDTIPTNLAALPPKSITFSVQAQYSAVISFATASDANAFFNAGGGFFVRPTFSPSITGNNAPHSNSWQTICDTANQSLNGGPQFFGATDYYATGVTERAFYTLNGSGSYSGNQLQLIAVNNNGVPGLSSQVTIIVRFRDSYSGGTAIGQGVGYGDSAGGLAQCQVTQRKSFNTIVGPGPGGYGQVDWTGS